MRRLLPFLAGAALAGCGSETIHELPPAAEPARAPVATVRAAGRVVRVGRAPEGLAADPRSHVVAIGLRDPAALALVDGATGRVRRRVALPGAPRHLAIDPATGDVLVPAEPADRLLRVDPRSGALRGAWATGAFPHDAAAAQGSLFAGDERGNTLTVVAPGGWVRRVRVATQPGGVTVTGDGRAVAVVAVRERVLELYDARTLRRIARRPAGVGPTHVAALGPWLWVTDTQGGGLLVFERRGSGLSLTRRVALPGAPYGIAVDPVRRRLYVTLTARNALVVLPAHGRPHPLRVLPTVRQPDSVAVDPSAGRVYVTGRVAGVLQILRSQDAEPEQRR